MAKSEICIIGAGISGLVLARCLLARGIEPIIFEKGRRSAKRNRYGITLHEWAYAPLLKALDIDPVDFPGQLAVDAAAGDMGRFRHQSTGFAHRINRARFEHLLAEGLDIRYEHQLQRLEKRSGIIDLIFTNNSTYQSRTVIGADGVHSQVRRSISPETELKILPYAVLNGKRRMTAAQFDNQLRRHIKDNTVLEHKVDDTLFSISMDEEDGDQICISYNFSRPARGADDTLYRPGRSKSDATEIPEAFFDEISGHDLPETFRSVFNPDAMKHDRLLNWLMRSLLIKKNIVATEARAGVALIGEALHAEPILGGNGANEAIQDGCALAEALANKQDLADFYDTRYDTWQTAVFDSERRISEMHGNVKPSL